MSAHRGVFILEVYSPVHPVSPETWDFRKGADPKNKLIFQLFISELPTFAIKSPVSSD